MGVKRNRIFMYICISVSCMGALLFWRRLSFADSLTVIGLGYLVVGVYRLVNRMGFFDSTRYGTRRLIELVKSKTRSGNGSETESYLSYVENTRHDKPYTGLIAIGLCLLAISIVPIAL